MKLTIIQATVPDYRVGLFKILAEKCELNLIAGTEYFAPSVKIKDNIESDLILTFSSNIYLFKRRALLQIWPGMFKELSNNSIRVVELNPRCLTSWLSLIFSFLFKRGNTIVWGHLNNRNGQLNRFSARRLMLKIADGVLFYTKAQQEQYFKSESLNIKTSGYAPNSVLYQNQIEYFKESGSDFIYVGRLVKDKKPLFMVQAFIKACKQGMDNSILHIVGDGPEYAVLNNVIEESDYHNKIKLYGHNNDYEFLKSLYRKSICSLSPGYVGLSITQSFSFGRPMLISENEPHSPEIESFSPNKNGEYFATDNINDFALKILNFYNLRDEWSCKAKKIATLVAENYTYESMASGYLDLVSRVKNER